jgi:hypothetical protein
MAQGSSKGARAVANEVGEVRRQGYRDTVVASVCWHEDRLFFIVVVRRSDAALAFVEVPRQLASELAHFNVDAVVAHAVALRAAVVAALPQLKFRPDAEVGDTPMRDGETPARLGAVRHFTGGEAFGVDVGEFELLQPSPWLM